MTQFPRADREEGIISSATYLPAFSARIVTCNSLSAPRLYMVRSILLLSCEGSGQFTSHHTDIRRRLQCHSVKADTVLLGPLGRGFGDDAKVGL